MVSVNIQQCSDISVAVHAMIGMTYPVGPQDADIEAVLLFYDFVVPYGKVCLLYTSFLYRICFLYDGNLKGICFRLHGDMCQKRHA